MPFIPTVKSKTSVEGTVGHLNRSFSDVKATPEMFGMAEARALGKLGDSLGSMFSAIGSMAEQNADASRREAVASSVATTNYYDEAVQAQNEVPANGEGLTKLTVDRIKQKIDEDAYRLHPNDEKAQRMFRIAKYGELHGYGRSAATQEFNLRSKFSQDAINSALNATDNRVRVDPSAYDAALQQSIEAIDASQYVTNAQKDHFKAQWSARLANTRFEGMLANAKTVDDIMAIERELKTPDPGEGADAAAPDGTQIQTNKWQRLLQQSGTYEALLKRLDAEKNTIATKFTADAKAELGELEKMSGDRIIIPAERLQQMRAKVDLANNPGVMERYARLMEYQRDLTEVRSWTPTRIFNKANELRGGAGMVYPGLPAEVNGYISETAKLFPGVSAAYLGATAWREYGANFPKAYGTKGNLKYAPAPQTAGVSIKGLQPDMQDRLTVAGELFGQPLTITSGYRDQAHQNRIRFRPGADPNRSSVAKQSYHTAGSAVDISTVGLDGGAKARLVDSLVQAGFTGFGEYETHIHADMRPGVAGSFDPRKGRLGWTQGSPEVMAVLEKRGFAPGRPAAEIDRTGPVSIIQQRAGSSVPVDYGKGTSLKKADGSPASTAIGLFQHTETGAWADFTDPTKGVGRSTLAVIKSTTGVDMSAMSLQQRLELRKDPRISTIVAGAYASYNKKVLEGTLKRDVSDAELYMAHFMGTEGATRFLRAYSMDPQQSAVQLAPDAADKNRPIYYVGGDKSKPRTVGQVYNALTAAFTRSPSQSAYVRSENLYKIGDSVREGLNVNPIGVAKNAGGVAVASLDKGAASWQARGRAVSAMAQTYELPTMDAKPFDANTEVQTLEKQIKEGTSEQVAEMLQNMAAMDAVAPGSMRAGLEQLGHANSAYGVAGDLMQNGQQDAAVAVIRGSKALQDDKSAAQSLLKQDGAGGDNSQGEFARIAGRALAGASPDARQALYLAANAHYVETYGPVAKNGFDKNLYAKSVNAVLGGSKDGRIGDINDNPTILPRGVKAEDMEKAVDNLSADDLIRYSYATDGRPLGAPPMYANGEIASPKDIADDGKFEYIAEDTYQVRMHDGTILVAPTMSEGGRPARYLIRLDAKAVGEINARPRKLQPDYWRGMMQ